MVPNRRCNRRSVSRCSPATASNSTAARANTRGRRTIARPITTLAAARRACGQQTVSSSMSATSSTRRRIVARDIGVSPLSPCWRPLSCSGTARSSGTPSPRHAPRGADASHPIADADAPLSIGLARLTRTALVNYLDRTDRTNSRRRVSPVIRRSARRPDSAR